MRTAEIDGLTRRSPCNGIDLPAETSGEEMHFLTPEQVAKLAETIDPRYRALIFTAAYTGMRAGELAALKVSRVNLLKRRLEVVESLSEVRGKLIAGPTKTHVRRSVTLPVFLADMLGEHIGTYSENGYVFTMSEGGPIRQGTSTSASFGKRSCALDSPKACAFMIFATLPRQYSSTRDLTRSRFKRGSVTRPFERRLIATATCSTRMIPNFYGD